MKRGKWLKFKHFLNYTHFPSFKFIRQIIEMHKNFLIFTDIGCGGIFFDNREFEKFDESHENAETIFKALECKTFKKVDEDKIRICPICHVPMVKQGAAGNNKIEIDVCNSCGGKFLDNGELQRVRAEAVKDSAVLNNMIISLYQKNLEKNSSNHNLESRRKFFQNFMNQFLD